MTDRLYARISLDTAASGSLAKQEAALRRAADGEPVLYVDRSVSGSKVPFGDRPEGARLLADLQPGDRLLVTKIDRAARNLEDLLGLVRRVGEVGAVVVFTEQNVNTEGPMGALLLQLLGAVAEFEAALISERRRESLAAFAAEGRHAVGSAPYGLQSVPNPSGRGLVLRPDPETAPALRDAVAALVSGSLSQAAAASGLGVPTSTFSLHAYASPCQDPRAAIRWGWQALTGPAGPRRDLRRAEMAARMRGIDVFHR